MKKDLRVLHVITDLGDGGAEAVLFRLCTHDKRAQNTVVSLMSGGKYGPLLRKAGVPVHFLGMPRGRVTLRGLWRLWRLIRRLHPDLMQTWMYHADLVGGVVARLAGFRSVVWGVHHGTLESGKSKRSTILVANACAGLSRWTPARIIVCAERAARVHEDLGYVANKMVVIPNGYDVSYFRVNPAAGKRRRAEWEIATQAALIGMVARFDPDKDHANLLDALKLLKDRGIHFCCALIGPGMSTDNGDLVSLLSGYDLDGNLRLLGQCNDIPAVMNALDLHVLSSASEAFPNALAEAMACGTPCVTTDVGDAAFIVGDSGWVVPPRNPEALADAIEEALQECAVDVEAFEARKIAARMRIEKKFSIATMVAKYEQTWRDVTAGSC